MLANFRQMLDAAQAGHYAVGAYDLINLEMLEGILDAAQESDTAVILQFAQVFEKAAGVDAADFGKAIVEAAKRATVPVAVHLDHGQDLEMVKKCVALGFNSVMIDASAKPFEENVRITKEVVDYCRPLGIPVIYGFPAGHEDPNLSLYLGREVTVSVGTQGASLLFR